LLLRLAEPHAGDLLVRLAAALAAAGWRLQSCGGCRWWQRVAVEEAEGMPQGQCTDAAGALPVLPDALAIQSMTALACGRFAAVVDVTPAAAAVAPVTMKPVTKRSARATSAGVGCANPGIGHAGGSCPRPPVMAQRRPPRTAAIHWRLGKSG
jgi:hypothetical protein